MTAKLSKVEVAKQNSKHLRGTILPVLRDESVAAFEHDDLQVLKFHGIYQQDDRDKRIERRKAGLDKAYSMMIRIALPGGKCSAGQYLDLDDLCDTHANGTLRVTTRQAFQLHGVLKGNLHATVKRIVDQLMTSLAACGDIPRNMTATPAPIRDEAHLHAQKLAAELALDLAPKSGAYHEIWIDGEKYFNSEKQALDGAGMVVDLPESEEPFYGNSYLPRKFKIGVALDTDNSIDAYTNDASLLAITENGKTLGYNLNVGGGFGMTHNKAETIARIASPIVFVPKERAVEAMRTVVAIFRDHGNREERRAARIKYLLEDWGVEKFRAEFEKRFGEAEDPRETPRPFQFDHLGRHEQGDGKQWVGVYIPSGRIVGEYKTAFRKIVSELRPEVVLTPAQSILFTDLTPEQADRVEAILNEHQLPLVETLSGARRYNQACVALPTCGLALTDAERAMPKFIEAFEAELEPLGLLNVPMTVRMTGCPNGCARPYNADIGLVGRKPGVYHLFVGGGLSGDRIADLFAADVPIGEVNAILRPLLQRFAAERFGDESLSDFYRRLKGESEDRKLICGKEEATADQVLGVAV